MGSRGGKWSVNEMQQTRRPRSNRNEERGDVRGHQVLPWCAEPYQAMSEGTLPGSPLMLLSGSMPRKSITEGRAVLYPLLYPSLYPFLPRKSGKCYLYFD